MNPFISIEAGSQVIVSHTVTHTKSNVPQDMVGKIFSVYEVVWDGRQHNRYVSCFLIKDKEGNQYKAVIDQLASVNPNYEPQGQLVVCLSCGVTMYEEELETLKSLNTKRCPHCGVLDPTES